MGDVYVHVSPAICYILLYSMLKLIKVHMIVQVHARDKAIDPSINWIEVARSMAGFTGADCMGLMQRAARMAARQVRSCL